MLLRDARCQHIRRSAFETGGSKVCDRHGRRLVGGLKKNLKTRETVKSCRSRSHGVNNIKHSVPICFGASWPGELVTTTQLCFRQLVVLELAGVPEQHLDFQRSNRSSRETKNTTFTFAQICATYHLDPTEPIKSVDMRAHTLSVHHSGVPLTRDPRGSRVMATPEWCTDNV